MEILISSDLEHIFSKHLFKFKYIGEGEGLYFS